MPRILLQTPELRLGIRPDLGAGVDEFAAALPVPAGRPRSFVDVWRRARPDASWFNDLACYSLIPWSNRIAAGEFSFGSTPRRLRKDWPDATAIHGATKDLSWSILDRSPFSARLGFDARDHRDGHASCNWPWDFTAGQRYELDGYTLHTEITITNQSRELMPAGAGWHPFFPRTLTGASGDEFVVRAAATGRYPAVGMLPTGPAAPDHVCERFGTGRPFADLDLDDVFTLAREGERAFAVEWTASGVGIEVSASADCGHLVVYSGRGPDGTKLPFVCVEPVTMVNDGFNLAARGMTGTGVRTIGPGETWSVRASWKVTGGEELRA